MASLSRHIADVHDNNCDVPTAKVLWFFLVSREVRHMYYWLLTKLIYERHTNMNCGYIVTDEMNEMVLTVWKQFKQLHFHFEKKNFKGTTGCIALLHRVLIMQVWCQCTHCFLIETKNDQRSDTWGQYHTWPFVKVELYFQRLAKMFSQ